MAGKHGIVETAEQKARAAAALASVPKGENGDAHFMKLKTGSARAAFDAAGLTPAVAAQATVQGPQPTA